MILFVQSELGRLLEPAPVCEIACSGLGRIEFTGGGQGCFVVYRNTISVESGEIERLVCGRLFAPLDAIPEAIDLMGRGLVAGMKGANILRRRVT